ncbi:hypothetical protein [Legionella sp.]|uniref:hypothetical protein n=1 Tax=Legionella sp. TaxID=459 RepID=UPI000CBD67AB|nr:hypothetical protein [Legionella sp.]PJE05780.1 MAG: hypothetical protein CK430_15305 [Legionella sp.]
MSREKKDTNGYSFFRLPRQNSPQRRFLDSLPRNACLALATVPAEGLTLRRIFYCLDNPGSKPPSYFETIKNIGFRGLFAGPGSRMSYCLFGNFATLLGVDYFGSDYKGLFMTTVAKNSIVPLFLVSNARQINLNWTQTYQFMINSIKDPVVHSSFFFRNLVANSCLLPGFMTRDFLYRRMDESNTTVPAFGGLAVSLTASTLMNSFLKPLFTGKYNLGVRLAVAIQFPAKLSLSIREFASLGLIFGSTSPQKKLSHESEETQTSEASPSLK